MVVYSLETLIKLLNSAHAHAHSGGRAGAAMSARSTMHNTKLSSICVHERLVQAQDSYPLSLSMRAHAAGLARQPCSLSLSSSFEQIGPQVCLSSCHILHAVAKGCAYKSGWRQAKWRRAQRQHPRRRAGATSTPCKQPRQRHTENNLEPQRQ